MRGSVNSRTTSAVLSGEQLSQITISMSRSVCDSTVGRNAFSREARLYVGTHTDTFGAPTGLVSDTAHLPFPPFDRLGETARHREPRRPAQPAAQQRAVADDVHRVAGTIVERAKPDEVGL